MYLNILKKDLKRKKTMNVIILMFIIISTLFVSGSVNNILAVFTGLDGYFEKANMPDYVMVMFDKEHPEKIAQTLDPISEINSYGSEEIIFVTEKNIKMKDASSSFLCNQGTMQINLFDENNKKIKTLSSGQIMFPVKALEQNDLKKGDKLNVTIGDTAKEFEVVGGFKDAAFGGSLIGNNRLLISDDDYKDFVKEDYYKQFSGHIICIYTDNYEAVKEKTESLNVLFDGPIDTFKLSYMTDMLLAGIILVISLLLIITAFIVLRFTIGYTISEEFREIGVMKAIGIRNSKIRMLYIIKYLALSAAGAFIGFWGSIPLSNFLLKSASKTIMLESEKSILINLVCSLFIIAIIFLFSYRCTHKVKKFTPLDAIRSGQTGERYHKKSVIHLSKSKLAPKNFLAVNDVLSSPKRYGMIVLIILLCLSPVLVCANSANTLKSPKLLPAFGSLDFDIAFGSEIIDADNIMKEGGEEYLLETISAVEEKLNELGMPGKCSTEVMIKATVSNGDKKVKPLFNMGVNSKCSDYHYDNGTAPQNPNEIALSHLSAKQLGVNIGDTVTVTFDDETREFMVTALYQAMNNVGLCGRFHEDTEINYSQLSGLMWFFAKFNDSPDDSTIKERIDILEDEFGDVKTAGEVVKETTGMGDSVDYVKYLSLVLALIIVMLVAILMERSFVTKERSELAMLKAIGFKSSQLRARHCVRMGITAVLGVSLSAALSTVLTKLTINPVFKMMGAVNGVEYDVKPLEIYLIYPIIIFAAAVFFTYIASGCIKSIKTSEVSGIE